MKRILLLALVSASFACATTPVTPKKAETPPATKTKTSSQAQATTTTVAAKPPRDIEGAMTLVEQGKKIQREKGEGGAEGHGDRRAAQL